MNDKKAKIEGWQPMDAAPKGGGAELVTDPNWVEPPLILLKFAGNVKRVGKWDWYYAEGGNGHRGCSAWVEPTSGELLAMYYDEPVGWIHLPE
jgi:hypothetical protein